MKLCIRILAVIATAAPSLLALAGEPDRPPQADPLESWWKHARAKIERVLDEQGRTAEAIECPKWFEQPYVTAGRMPLVDLCLSQPLVMPEVAGTADRRVREAGGSMVKLFDLTKEMAAGCANPAIVPEEIYPAAHVRDGAQFKAALATFLAKVREAGLGEGATRDFVGLLTGVAAAAGLREAAFAGFSEKERKRVAELLPGYFVRHTSAGETIRGYTAQLDDLPELFDLLRKVDFASLEWAGLVLARTIDEFVAGWKQHAKEVPADSRGVIFEMEAGFGRIVIAGSGNDTHVGDAALLVDLGGDDVYMNHAAATSLDGPGAAILIDISGNDRYLSSGMAQSSAICGVSALVDLEGDDVYASGHYSQGAALCGHSFFYEGAGDDTYVGELGVQCFALFGTSVFHEAGGRDSYRCASMGQGCASTLGVAVLSEAGGDDAYRSGGKHGFYETWDASCAQGAASGMRPWPPHGRTTVYGGVGFLSEAAGNDTYSGYIIGQGGSYIFALGMIVDSEGDDVYSSLRYSRGVGVHLGAAVAIDRKGNDVYTGDYGNNSMSLDRSSGVFIDLEGDDVYRVAAGLGYCNKPRGCSIFVDAKGNDTYRGKRNVFGSCNPLYGEDTESTAFFLDFGGVDTYPDGKFSNGGKWSERAFGFGQDEEVSEPSRGGQVWWDFPALPAAFPGGDGMASLSPLIRFAASKDLEDPVKGGIDKLLAVAGGNNGFAKRDLVDAVRHWLIRKRLDPAGADRLLPLLSSPDRDLRILALFAWMSLKSAGPEAVKEAGRIALSDSSPDARGMACLALGRSGSGEALPFLLKALKSLNPSVRRRAAIGLSELKAKEAADELLRALESDPSPDVRAHAADALGALKDEKYLSALRSAFLDGDGLVRFYASRALLKDFGRPEAMEHLIALARWDGGALRDTLVWGFLKSYTGAEVTGGEKGWREWWLGAGQHFDAAKAGKVYAMCLDADEATRAGDQEKALRIYREIRKLNPRHAAACEEVSKALNSVAWNIATSGKDYEKGLRLAEEAVDAKPDPDAVDTLAVLQFLTGDKKKAEETVEKSLESVKGDKAEMLKRRLQEIKAGKLNLH